MNDMINVRIENVNGILVTTSNRVAEELGVLHKDLLKKIDNYGSRFDSAESFAQFYIPSEYKDLSGKTNRNYYITEKGVAQLVGGYSAAVPKAFKLNVAYINEFERMKQTLSTIKVPTTFKEALLFGLDLAERLEKAETENKVHVSRIEMMKPKEEFYDTVIDSKDAIDIGKVSKILDFSNMGRNRLFSFLREHGVLMNNNVPYQRYIDAGYFRVIETIFTMPSGETKVNTKTLVYQKGVDFIRKLLTNNIFAKEELSNVN